MVQHKFVLNAIWPGGRNDVGTIEAGNLQTKISIPPEMDGPGIGTNPDEMLLGAAATCYLITLAAMLERANVKTNALTLQSEGFVRVENGVFTYEKIVHMPAITLAPTATARDEKMARRLAEKAETTCMISKAIQGNVQLGLNVTIERAI